jgi:hypothetical protein
MIIFQRTNLIKNPIQNSQLVECTYERVGLCYVRPLSRTALTPPVVNLFLNFVDNVLSDYLSGNFI